MAGMTIALIGLVVISAYLYSRYRHSFWSSKGIQTPSYIPFLGHMLKITSSNYPHWIREVVYKGYCRNGFCGLYEGFTPNMMVGDPELIKAIMVKDFDHFTDRRAIDLPHERDKAMNDMLINVNGEPWKNLRSMMTPTFTSGKLRAMFDLVCEKADILVSFCLQESTNKPAVDVKENFSRFVLDTIATCAFGFESNCMNEGESIFSKRTAIFTDFSSFGQICKLMIMLISPRLYKALHIPLYPSEVLFFNDIIDEAIAARRKGEKRGDFLDLLLEAQSTESNTKKSSKMVLTDLSIVAQSILFILAGYDTTASALAYTSHHLSKNREIQRRLREDLQEMVKEYGGVTYQGIMDAKYLEACILEALRMNPPLPVHERVCTKPYQVPGTNITLKPGYLVQIPAESIHKDEQYWPEPEVYNPDRFMPENKENITSYTHLPFGIGPRNCIAMRFALMESKIALAKMVLAIDMELAPGHEELKVTTSGGITKPDGGVHLLLTPINEE